MVRLKKGTLVMPNTVMRVSAPSHTATSPRASKGTAVCR